MITGKMARIALVVLEAFLGVTAVIGGVGLLLGWEKAPVSQLQGSPFGSYLIPGLALMVLVGGSAIVAAAAVWRGQKFGALASAVSAAMILGFEVVEYAVIGYQSGLQVFYVLVGFAILALAAPALIGRLRMKAPPRGAGRVR